MGSGLKCSSLPPLLTIVGGCGLVKRSKRNIGLKIAYLFQTGDAQDVAGGQDTIQDHS